MTDTPDHIYQLQLEIWLSKPPMERLRQMMEDNAALYQFWNSFKDENKIPSGSSAIQHYLKETDL